MKRTFRTFLEATGDHEFDKMMGAMKAKATAARDFDERVKGAVADFATASKRQHDLEHWVEQELIKSRMIPAKVLHKVARELKPVADEYREDTNPLELLYFHASSKDKRNHYNRKPDGEHEENLQDVCDAFLQRHLDLVQSACDSWMAALDRLKDESNKKDWPIKQWQRTTKYDSERHHARSVIEFLEHWWK